jgi:SWI/SNF-related matrix-associated actin-dependent regulator of chromatin subfamily A member 5
MFCCFVSWQGDEMGLGKTLQTITLLAHLKFVEGVSGPHLVVCPLSVLSSWVHEFKKFCPGMRILVVLVSQAKLQYKLV